MASKEPYFTDEEFSRLQGIVRHLCTDPRQDGYKRLSYFGSHYLREARHRNEWDWSLARMCQKAAANHSHRMQ